MACEMSAPNVFMVKAAIKPISITLPGSKLVTDRFKAKFHYNI